MYDFSNQIFGGGGDYSSSLSYDPSSSFNVDPSMDYSFSPNSFMDYSFEPDYSFESDYSFDPFMDDSYGGIDPVALAGLGGAAAFQGMFPFASEPTASNIIGRNLPAGGVNPQVTGPVSQGLFQSSNIIGRNLPAGGANPQITGPVSRGSLRPVPNQPVLMGQPQSYQGVPTGPNTPPQFTGNAPARPIPGTQLAPPSQPPAVRFAGGAPANTARPMKAAQRVGPPATIAGGAAATGLLARLSPYAAAATGGYFGGKAIDAFGGDALRAVGFTDREGNISDMLGSTIGEALYGDGNLPAFSEEELAQIQQGSVASDTDLPQMSRLGDEPLVFNAPTGPSSTATQAAQIAATLPDDSGLMGAPGIQGTGIPTTTLNIDGGSVTVPQALADQTFQGIGSAPMSIEETRARLGGRKLNQYLNAPDGTVSGLRTDPQGRMIPTSEDQQDTGGLSEYEKASADRYARMDERKRRPGESRTQRDTRLAQGETERTLYGGYTESQLRDLFGQQNLRAAKAKLSAGVDPITNERLSDARRNEYDNALKTQILEERLINYRQEDPDKFEKARVLVEKMIQSNQIAPQDGNQYMLRALNLDKKSFDEGSESALMKMIREAGEGSGGNDGASQGRSDIPQEAIDALRSNPSKASEFDQYFGQGSSAQFL